MTTLETSVLHALRVELYRVETLIKYYDEQVCRSQDDYARGYRDALGARRVGLVEVLALFEAVPA